MPAEQPQRAGQCVLLVLVQLLEPQLRPDDPERLEAFDIAEAEFDRAVFEESIQFLAKPPLQFRDPGILPGLEAFVEPDVLAVMLRFLRDEPVDLADQLGIPDRIEPVLHFLEDVDRKWLEPARQQRYRVEILRELMMRRPAREAGREVDLGIADGEHGGCFQRCAPAQAKAFASALPYPG